MSERKYGKGKAVTNAKCPQWSQIPIAHGAEDKSVKTEPKKKEVGQRSDNGDGLQSWVWTVE
ncbi:hypothetical protein N7539_002872 [Penicillium diatomitis]|uniref:Uncharacterized protein n=1 Tax=Penicillium diatomitis TaxID=2819901 RepID=A0A9X0BZ14_9EURO|nr:uncharacterized protein N7539_002872 [Penicillium diatomitis]KAJ5491305.1 hypothetical protein N7539_002872 [Penicillium diatomitis]